MLGIDPTVLMIVLLLIGLGAAMVFIGQMKSRVDKLEAGLVRQSQLFSKFVADTAVMFSAGPPPVQGGGGNGAAPEALMTARDVVSPATNGAASDQFGMENPRRRIPVPDEESDDASQSDESEGEESEGETSDDDLSSEGSESEDEEEVREADTDAITQVDLDVSINAYDNSTDSAVKIVSLEPGEPSEAAISISQMYNITMMGGPVPVNDDEAEVRVEELDTSTLDDDDASIGTVEGRDEDEGGADDNDEKDGDEDSAVMKKMKVADLRSLVVTMNISTAIEASKLKKPELLKLIEDHK